MRQRYKQTIFGLILTGGVLSLVLFGLLSSTALAANPQVINFQGKVVNSDGTNVSDGSYTFVFRLYDSSSASNISTNCSDNSHCWWEETDSLTVTSGVFQVELGAGCSFGSACNSTHSGINWNTNNTLYLTMNFNGDSSGSYHGFMTPLVQLGSVPYAFNADNLGGISASGFIQNNSGSAQASSNFHISGTGTADTALQAPSFDTATSNGALGIGTTDAGVITLGNVTNSTFLFDVKSSASAILVQNSSGYNLLALDSSTNHLKVYDGTAAQNYVDIYYNDGTSTAVIGASTGTVQVGSGSGPISLNSGSGAAVTITANAASSWTTTAGNLSIDTVAGSSLLLGTAANETITLGNTSGTSTLTFGQSTQGETVNIANGTVAAGKTNTVAIGTSATSTGIDAVTIGSTNSTSAITVQGGVNGSNATLNLQTATSGVITIGAINNSDTITIGSTALSTGTQTINIGNTNTSGGTTNISIGTGASATGGTTTLQGEGTVTVQSTGAGLTIDTTAAGQTTAIDNSAVTHTVQIATGAAVQGVTIGSTNSTSAITVQGGVNGTTETLQLQVAASGFIGIGTANTTKTIDIGSVGTTAAASTIHIADTSDATNNQIITIGSTANAANTITLQGGSTLGVLVKPAAGTAAFQVQNGSSNQVLTVDTSGNQVVFGKSATLGGALLFNTAGAGAITINTASTASNYTITLPTAGAASFGQCIQTTGSSLTQLTFGACTATGLGKNVADVSAASIGAASYLYSFTNSNSAVSGGVLQLNNGTNTGQALNVIGAETVQASSAPTGTQLTVTGSGQTVTTTGLAGLKIIAPATNGSSGFTYTGLAVTGPASQSGNDTDTAISVATGWDIGLNLDSGGIQMAAMANPAAPAANELRIYAKNIAGRILPKWIGPAGVDTPIQASFGFNRIAMVVPSQGTAATTIEQGFGVTFTNGGTTTTYSDPALATTNLATSVRRARIQTTTAGTTAIGYHIPTALLVWRGNALYGSTNAGGFFFTIRFDYGALNTNSRSYVGMVDATSTPTSVVPTTATTPGKLGVGFTGYTSGSTTFSWINNVTGTAPTTQNTSIGVNLTDLYELVVYVPPNGTSVGYRVTDISTGTVYENDSVTTNIPTNTTFMAPEYWVANGGTAGAVSIDSSGWYLESDN